MNTKQKSIAAPTETPADGLEGHDVAAPVKAGDIPGLGPIRVRALVKAGYGEAIALRAATLEQLMAVPGMSEIKARHIQTYLAQFTEKALRGAEEAARQRERTAQQHDPANTQPNSRNEIIAPALAWASASSPLEEPAQQALQMAIRLLMTEPATGYRARLLRETIGFMRLAALLIECGPLSAKYEERGLRRMNGALAALSQAVARPEMDRKEQTRLADQLAQVRERLEALVGQTLRAAPSEAEDE